MATQQMTKDDFLEKIFDYTSETEWKFTGSLPAIIDFYADWCGPCKAVAPVLEELSGEYEGKIDIYKINTDIEQELAAVFSIQSIPTFLFIPQTGTPMLQRGALSKSAFKDVIENKLINTSAVS